MRNKIIRWTVLAASVGTVSFALAMAGCSWMAPSRPQAALAAPEATASAASAPAVPASGKTGVQLWAEQCGRCHNARPPDWRTKADIEVAVHHMRIRAPLTGEDEREIVKFLTGQ